MGKHPQKLKETLSNKACLSQVLVQELENAPKTLICPTRNLWFQWHFCHLQPVWWIPGTPHTHHTSNWRVRSYISFCKFFNKDGRKINTNQYFGLNCAAWFYFFFFVCFLQSMGFIPPFKSSHHQLTTKPMERNSFSITISQNVKWF